MGNVYAAAPRVVSYIGIMMMELDIRYQLKLMSIVCAYLIMERKKKVAWRSVKYIILIGPLSMKHLTRAKQIGLT